MLLPSLALAAACAAPAATANPARCAGPLEAVASRADERLGEAAPEAVVASVEVRGRTSVPAELIHDAIALEVGAMLDPEQVRSDIRAILALRVFEDVRVTVEPAAGGVAVVYELEERPLVSSAVLVGDAGDAARHRVERLHGEVFRPGRLERLAQKITADRQREGYAEARTVVGAQRSDEGVAVCVHADTGRRWIVEELRFEGNEAIDDDALLAVMGTLDGRVNAAGGVYRPDLLADDRVRMLALYYDAGRVMARVEPPSIRWDGDALIVTISIAEGPVYRLGELRVVGDLDGPANEYRDLMGLEEGEVFGRAAVAAAVARVRERHRERSWTVEPITQIDEERRVVDLTIEITDPEAPETPRLGGADAEVGLSGGELSLDPSLAPEGSP